MRKTLALVVYLLSLMVATHAAKRAPATSTRTFAYGVNGHPIVAPAYRDISIDEQFRLIRDELGARWYRVGFSQSTLKLRPDQIKEVLSKAQAKGINLLVDLAMNLPQDPTEDIETTAYVYAKQLVSVTAPYGVTHYELLNETDIPCKTSSGPKAYGYQVTEFSDTCASKYVRVMNGMIRAIREANPAFKILLGPAGTHTGYLTKLQSLGLKPFDIVSWHWYSDLTDEQFLESYNALSSAGKPIWITEYNRRNGSVTVTIQRDSNGNVIRGSNGIPKIKDVQASSEAEKEQSDYVRQISARAQDLPFIQGLFIYELLDEMASLSNPESYYGLVRVKRNPNYTFELDPTHPYKPVFLEYKKIVSQ